MWSASWLLTNLSSQCYRDLALVSRDGMNIVLNKINQILMEKYLKLQDTCRTQVRPETKEIQLKDIMGGIGGNIPPPFYS